MSSFSMGRFSNQEVVAAVKRRRKRTWQFYCRISSLNLFLLASRGAPCAPMAVRASPRTSGADQCAVAFSEIIHWQWHRGRIIGETVYRKRG
eukprot:1398085-Prymnesium_polylepis.1